jgi:hypothetical protein
MVSGRRIFTLLVGFTLLGCGAYAQSDFDEYVASIRDSGMTERAAGDVRMMAGVLAGTTPFEASRLADGTVRRSYGGPRAAGRVPTPHQLRTRAAENDAWTDFLRTRADSDQSGFVSTKEGAALRRLIEMALVAEQLQIRTLDDPAAREEGLNAPDLAAYSAIRAEALKQGLGMPVLPSGLEAAPR